MDRRALFFVIAAVVCLALTPVADAAHRVITYGLASIYALLAAASYLDWRSRRREGE